MPPEHVDWTALRTAHGSAQNIPIALEALASASDPAQVQAAYWKLDNHIVLQGTIYDSAYFAVSHIIEILRAARWAPRRVVAYDLLIEIARGVPDPKGPSSVTTLAGVVELRTACRSAIASAAPLAELDLRSADHDVRQRALALLTSLDLDRESLLALLAPIDPGDDVDFAAALDQAKREL